MVLVDSPGARACDACSRRKSKCDKRRPTCSLCSRLVRVCEYPSKRKTRVCKNPRRDQLIDNAPFARLPSLRALEASPATRRVAGQATDKTQDVTAKSTHTSTYGFRPGDNSNSCQSDYASDGHHSMSPLDTFPVSPTEWQDNHPLSSGTRPAFTSECAESTMSYAQDDPLSREEEGVGSGLAIELVNLFFEKIQPWLPMLHRPRFHHKYDAKLKAKGNVMEGLTTGEALLLYGMFALSARYSDNNVFSDIPDSDKGNVFAEQAIEIYIQSHLVRQPLLLQLQGYLVLANHQHATGPTTLGRVLVGQCLQVAYALGLNDMDHPSRAMRGQAMDGVEKEEMRRAWWLLWELDTFASCASGKPFLIDRRRISVLLPISDEAWFAETEVESTQLTMGPNQSWKCLEGSPNQDERAWSLAGIHLMATALDRLQQPKPLSMEEKLALQNEVACFKLALPLSASLDSKALNVTPTTIARRNWVIAIHLILMTTSFMVDGVAAIDHGERGDPKAIMAAAVRQRATTLSGIIRVWDPSSIVLVQPFLMCAMIPALAMHEDTDSVQPLISSTNEMAVLVLKRFRSKWKLGDIMLEVARLRKDPSVVKATQEQLLQRYTIFFARSRTSKAIMKPSSDQAKVQSQNQAETDHVLSTRTPLQQGQYPQESNPDQVASTTLRLDPFELDWTGWRDLALDPLGFPAVQSDVYDFDFNIGPLHLESSNFMQNIEDDCILDRL